MNHSDHILAAVEHVRRMIRRTVIEHRLSTALSTLVPILFLIAALDRILRFPSPFRWVVLFGIGAFATWLTRRYLVPAIRFRPTLVQVALRIEDRIPKLSGRLATGVEFSVTGQASGDSLAARSIEDLDSRISTGSMGDVARTGPAHRRLATAIGIVSVIAAIGVWNPDLVKTASIRMFAPWVDVRWPARTEMVSMMPEALIHPRGEPVALAVDLVKGIPGTDRVSVRLRRIGDDVDRSWKTLVMTPQSAGVHERIIDTDVDRIEYQFVSRDWETPIASIDLVPAPRVRSSSVSVEPPEYAGRLGVVEQGMDSGFGRRSRLVRPALEGSEATLRLELDRPVPVPIDDDGVVERDFLLRTVVSDPFVDPTLSVDPDDPAIWTVRWEMNDSSDIEFVIEDEHGISNIDPIRYRFPVAKDRPPSVTIVDPKGDRRVTPDAMVAVAADAVDDVGLDGFRIEATLESVDGRSNEPVVLVEFAPRTDGTDAADASISSTLSLSSFDPNEGDAISLVAIASDRRPVDDPRIKSAVRRLQVVSESVIVDEIQSALAGIRRSAIRLEDDQAGLEDAVRDRGADSQVLRGQERLGERLESAMQTLDSIDRRRRENQVGDEILSDLIDQANQRLEAASAASAEATERLDRSNRSSEGSEPIDADAAIELQQEVRDELTDLAATLDRGEDAWVVTRQIERLAEDLAELQARTSELADRTMGRDRTSLSEEERRAVDELGREQSELADRAEELIDDLRQRSEALAEIDRNESAALEETAEQAQREGLESEMRDAAEAAQENRLQQAGRSQQRASEALGRMQETMEEIRKAKVEELRRRMESLVESLESLVTASEDGLSDLARVDDPSDTPAIVAHTEDMIRLQRNTASVAVDAGRSDERIGRLVERASDRQGASIVRLRSDPPEIESARESQEQALQQLQEALESARSTAERLAQQQADAERDRLLEAYRSIRDRQLGVRIETEEIVPEGGAAIGRRERIASRRLGTRESEIQTALRDVTDEFTEVQDSLVFSMTHRRVDRWVEGIRERLRDGDPSRDVVEDQIMVIDAITGLIEALEDSQPPEDPFGQEQAGGGGAGGGGEQAGGPQSLIPPIAELKMLRSMQRQILEATRRIDTERSEGDPVESRLIELSEMQSDLHGVATALIASMEPDPMDSTGNAGDQPTVMPDDADSSKRSDSEDGS